MLPELYHAHHSLHLEDLPFWLELAAGSGGSILELGCGSGRLMLPLLRSGHQVVGIDTSLPMLKFAQNLIRAENFSSWLVAADMRRFHLGVKFSLILLPCNTYSTIDHFGRLACLACARRHINPGGRFVFSIPNPDRLRSLPRRSELELEDEFTHPRTGFPVQVSSAWQRNKGRFSVTWSYDHLLPDGRVERVSETVAHELLPADSYLDEIRSAGFEICSVYGDFDRSNYQQDSPSLICICSAPDC